MFARTPFRGVLPVLFALCLSASSVSAQKPALDAQTRQAAHELLTAMGAAELLISTVQAGIPDLKASSPGVPEEFWTAFTTALALEADLVVESLVPTYASHFSASEMRGLTKFYQSPLGKRLLEEQPTLITEAQQIGKEWGARIAERIITEIMAAEADPDVIGSR